MANNFDGKVALVTGGSSGIGRATAIAFAKAGAKVVIADVDAEGGNETVRMVKELDGEAIFIKADVSKSAEVEALIDKAVQSYGELHCAVNNAAIEGPTTLTVDHTEEEWDSVIDTNLKGVWLCMKYEIPQMLRQGGGVIVNVSSDCGLVGTERTAAYTASKHGVIGLTKTAAIEYAKAGIRVNAVCPGAIDTPMMKRVSALGPREAHIIERSPAGRMATPEEIAMPVVWLCSEAASFVIGHAMCVDGGLFAQ